MKGRIQTSEVIEKAPNTGHALVRPLPDLLGDGGTPAGQARDLRGRDYQEPHPGLLDLVSLLARRAARDFVRSSGHQGHKQTSDQLHPSSTKKGMVYDTHQ